MGFRRAEETSAYSWSMFCTINHKTTTNIYQLSHLKSDRDCNSDSEVGGECVTTVPPWPHQKICGMLLIIGDYYILCYLIVLFP